MTRLKYTYRVMLAASWTFILLAGTAAVQAQEIDPPVFGRVDVVSEPRGAEVYLGDSLLGRTPLRIRTEEADRVRLYYPSRRGWNAQEAGLSLPVPEAGKGVAVVRFERRVQLRTLPHGARVFRGDSLLGITPCSLSHREGSLRVDALGYRSVNWDPASSSRPEYLLLLDPMDENAVPQVQIQDKTLRLPSTDILLSAGCGLIAGVAAVILKQKADGYYDDYLFNGNESLLSQTKKYDIYAGISLTLMQLGLGYIIYRLFDE